MMKRSPMALARFWIFDFRFWIGLVAVTHTIVIGSSPAQEISWSVPEDGGTPRDTNRIERLGPIQQAPGGPQEFRIRASFEEGGQSVLRHAVSRLDLFCHNSGARALDVTVHLELSGDGQRTDYDTKPESGMALRDFL